MEKSIFVTGAASGIGKAAALRFAREGWFVGLYDVDERGLSAVRAEVGPERSSQGVLDVTDLDAYRRAVTAFGSATRGRMDVLFGCAGILRLGRFEDVPPAEAQKEIAVNVGGVVNGVYAALPLLEKTERSLVLSMSSASAIYGVPEHAVYSATKFAVRGLTEALDLELRSKGIRVADLMPGYVDTPMVQSQTHRAGTLRSMGVKLTAEDVAELAWEAAHGDKVHWMPRLDIKIMARFAGFGSLARPLMRRFSGM